MINFCPPDNDDNESQVPPMHVTVHILTFLVLQVPNPS